MLKKIFGKKNKDTEIPRDEWIKRDYILVPNDTKPSDLKEYQKLIVLRKPEGEQRCIVDYSLPFNEVDKLHLDSLENTVDLKTDLFDKNLKRIIPTYLNTKEIDDNLNNTDWDEITYSSKSIREAADSFRIADEEFADALVKVPNKEIPIIRLDEENGQVLLTKLEIQNYEKQDDLLKLNLKRKENSDNAIDDIEIDDIDGVDILTEKDLEIRDSWVDVDYYFESKEKVEKRKVYSDVDLTLSPFYVPKVQPLFRNFIDVNFHSDDVLGKLKGNDTTLYEQGGDAFILENEDPIIEKYDDEFVDFSENATSEDPEMIIGDLAVDNSPTVSIEQPKVLSFFKNEVSTNNKSSFGQSEHINKHSKFYNAKNVSNGRNIKYEKIILNKKRGIFNIRRTISKE